MDQQLQGMFGASSDMLAVRHRVLRNTYWLLALSMIPTVMGAWLGLQIHFSLFAGSPMISFIAFLAIAFGFFYAIEKTKDGTIKAKAELIRKIGSIVEIPAIAVAVL